MSGVRLQYVSDPVAEAATALASALGAKVASVDEVFSDPGIDAVVIASSTDTHSDLLSRAAHARKHIFCEKPIDLSLERVRACAEAVQSAGMAPDTYMEVSGGIFRDMLIHDFDIFRWILCADGDEAQWLSATGSVLTDPAIAAAGDLDSTAVTIRTRKGRLCQINTIRRSAYGYDQRFEVLGSLGMLQCGNHKPSEVSKWDAQGIHGDKPENFFLQRYAAAYRLEIAHFFECLQTGAAFRTTVADGLAAQELADAAAQSARTGLPVTW